LLAHVADPGRQHRACTGSALAADDAPMDAAQIEPHAFKQRFDTQKTARPQEWMVLDAATVSCYREPLPPTPLPQGEGEYSPTASASRDAFGPNYNPPIPETVADCATLIGPSICVAVQNQGEDSEVS
jgi:hypothetical protein